jgi:hypothetical protein
MYSHGGTGATTRDDIELVRAFVERPAIEVAEKLAFNEPGPFEHG